MKFERAKSSFASSRRSSVGFAGDGRPCAWFIEEIERLRESCEILQKFLSFKGTPQSRIPSAFIQKSEF